MVFALLATLSALVAAEVVVITNTQNSVDQASREEITNIFMGRYRRWPNGAVAVPFDLESDSPIRKSFYRQLVDKSQEEINAYWTRLVFAGRTTPPPEARNQGELLEKIANHPHAIGYIDRAYLNRSAAARNIKVLLALPDLTDTR